jgi:hypothetical protein
VIRNRIVCAVPPSGALWHHMSDESLLILLAGHLAHGDVDRSSAL